MIPLSDIRAAADRIRGIVHRTPVVSARSIGALAGVELHLKCELLQKTGSFKPRGALNKVLSLPDAERARGLVFVHPFDDPVVLAGAGTTGLEIAEDVPSADVVIVPVGGGGLLGGVAS